MTAEQSASINKQAMAATPSSPGAGNTASLMPRKPGMPGANEPSIKVSKPADYKPKPNDSSTSSQWYTDETKH